MRTRHLYSGDPSDQFGQAMSSCAQDGPVLAYVGKMVPVPGGGKGYFALARVFAGTIKPGQVMYAVAAAAPSSASSAGAGATPPCAKVTRVVEVTGHRYVLLFALNYCLPSTTVCPQLLFALN